MSWVNLNDVFVPNTGGTVYGDLNVDGHIIAGDGSSIANLNAGNITSGTLPIERGGTGVTTEKEIALKSYPVGAVYLSFSPISPALLFGGTWTQINGYFLRAADDTDTGGSDTHTLTVDQMPSHTHNLLEGYQPGSSIEQDVLIYDRWNIKFWQNSPDKVSSTGGNAAHNNMPLYQDVYAWRRTA